MARLEFGESGPIIAQTGCSVNGFMVILHDCCKGARAIRIAINRQVRDLLDLVLLLLGAACGILSASNTGTDLSGTQEPCWGERALASAIEPVARPLPSPGVAGSVCRRGMWVGRAYSGSEVEG